MVALVTKSLGVSCVVVLRSLAHMYTAVQPFNSTPAPEDSRISLLRTPTIGCCYDTQTTGLGWSLVCACTYVRDSKSLPLAPNTPTCDVFLSRLDRPCGPTKTSHRAWERASWCGT